MKNVVFCVDRFKLNSYITGSLIFLSINSEKNIIFKNNLKICYFFFENCEYSKIFLFILVNTIYTTRLKLIFLKILVFFLIRIKKSTFFLIF